MWRCACAVALLCVALAHADETKRAEMAASPFVLGSRYGRSAPRAVSSRNDRFFLSSRYGKRSEAVDRPGGPVERWRPCDCRPYRAALLALTSHFHRSPEETRPLHQD